MRSAPATTAGKGVRTTPAMQCGSGQIARTRTGGMEHACVRLPKNLSGIVNRKNRGKTSEFLHVLREVWISYLKHPTKGAFYLPVGAF